MAFKRADAERRGLEKGTVVYFIDGENDYIDSDSDRKVVKKGVLTEDPSRKHFPSVIIQKSPEQGINETGLGVSKSHDEIFTGHEIISALNRYGRLPVNGELPDNAVGEIDNIITNPLGNYMLVMVLGSMAAISHQSEHIGIDGFAETGMPKLPS